MLAGLKVDSLIHWSPRSLTFKGTRHVRVGSLHRASPPRASLRANGARGRCYQIVTKRSTTSKEKAQDAFNLFHNKGLSNRDLADMFGVSIRTICRWKRRVKVATHSSPPKPPAKRKRKRRHLPGFFTRALALKQELPRRSAAGIHRLLTRAVPPPVPCESTIRKFLAANRLSGKGARSRE